MRSKSSKNRTEMKLNIIQVLMISSVIYRGCTQMFNDACSLSFYRSALVGKLHAAGTKGRSVKVIANNLFSTYSNNWHQNCRSILALRFLRHQ